MQQTEDTKPAETAGLSKRADAAGRVLELIRAALQHGEAAEGNPRPFVIALDGRAASGKTTLANELAKALQAPVIRMDDFFLPPELRSPERYATPGANVHKERFASEVLVPLQAGKPVVYRQFDCHEMDYVGRVELPQSPVLIVEGSYSLHPEFGDYADLAVFVTVSPEEQMRRILERNGAAWAEDFRKKWIPLEEAYFNAFDIPSRADVILDNE